MHTVDDRIVFVFHTCMQSTLNNVFIQHRDCIKTVWRSTRAYRHTFGKIAMRQETLCVTFRGADISLFPAKLLMIKIGFIFYYQVLSYKVIVLIDFSHVKCKNYPEYKNLTMNEQIITPKLVIFREPYVR